MSYVREGRPIIILWLSLLFVAMVVTVIGAFLGKIRTVPTIAVLGGVSFVAFRLIEYLPVGTHAYVYLAALVMTFFSLAMAIILGLIWAVRLLSSWLANR